MGVPATIWQEIEATLLSFLLVELDLGMTFAKAAADAAETRERLHNRMLARSAYDTVVRLESKAKPAGESAAELAAKMAELRSALCGLGDPL
jgi:hypothetical protein